MGDGVSGYECTSKGLGKPRVNFFSSRFEKKRRIVFYKEEGSGGIQAGPRPYLDGWAAFAGKREHSRGFKTAPYRNDISKWEKKRTRPRQLGDGGRRNRRMDGSWTITNYRGEFPGKRAVSGGFGWAAPTSRPPLNNYNRQSA